MWLDIQYGSTQQEREYVKETLDTEGVKALFDKELKDLSTKIVNNFHADNYNAFETSKTFDTEKASMKAIIDADADMKAKYETALAKNKTRIGFSEWILLLQTIAIKCVNIINQSESVETKLTSRDDIAYKSQAMDGILGPNTFYVLASIAKEKWISFNGVVDKTLLDAMISICGEAPNNSQNITPDKTTEEILQDVQSAIDAYDGKWTLDLSEKGITDDILAKILSTLETLPNLTTLDLSYNGISKIQGFDKLTNLTTLHFSWNSISKIEGLDKLTNLTTLYLNENNISKIEGLDNLTNLTTLEIDWEKISKIEGLDKLTNLTTLYLYWTNISKIEGLDNLTKLTKLGLDNNKISKIEGLDKLINLTELDIYGNQITKIEGLDKLVNLTELYIYANQITKIEGLDKLVNLTQLRLNGNQISKIEGLETLVKLSRITLYDNNISKIEGLETLSELLKIEISDNKINKIEGLDNLNKLELFDARNNAISKIEGLDNLTNLTKLALRGNQITKIEGVDKLTKLTSFDLRNDKNITPDNNQQTEVVDAATMKTALEKFSEATMAVKLYSKVEKSDYEKLFAAVATAGDETKIKLAYTYLQALISGDQTMAGATDDMKYPGIITFGIICKNLGQEAIYTEVKARLEGKKATTDNSDANEDKPIISSYEETKKKASEVDSIIAAIAEVSDDINMYTNRKELSEEYKADVKKLYEQIGETEEQTEIRSIINAIEDIKILQGLNDLFVKKIVMKKEKGTAKELEDARTIAQMIVDKENEIFTTTPSVEALETIKKTQDIINAYTTAPNTFTLKKATWEKVFDYTKEEDKPLIQRVTSVNFTLMNNDQEIGIIGFDIDGKLLTKEVTKDDKTYLISQTGTTITVTEKNQDTPVVTTQSDIVL